MLQHRSECLINGNLDDYECTEKSRYGVIQSLGRLMNLAYTCLPLSSPLWPSVYFAYFLEKKWLSVWSKVPTTGGNPGGWNRLGVGF